MKLIEFPFISYDKIRYCDTDRQGHVNNAVFSTFLETGRVEILLDPDASLAEPDAEFVVASMSLQLLGEIRWPGEVQIGTSVSKIGNSSVGLYQQLFQNDACVASAETVIVQMNTSSRKAQPLSVCAREFLAANVKGQINDE
ncbi:acyl-CoA thioesterase YbgC [Marinobacterium sp. xm-a-121]|uniref:acyl-CoA thioesterase n=1 Tax=unclassified Marinobacterium TaxID=2644139 RepID=UPI0015694DE5|nr:MULTISPECIES: thioesterase family protein [unclassified Marinobacterium]NRP38751.1 acyl-CoA thioesterase YbgC [Marinobacterium sp. xm-a-121]NRP99567.1 acyl-CoA thioesterase YbgC [Marinobacterium sp. xm-v-233]